MTLADYGTCEGCGGNVAEHCLEDATGCVADWPVAGSTPEQRERIHASLCGAPDYNAALALYWWMHLASEHFYGESWPFQWEDQLRAWVENGLPAGTREPYAGWREEGQRLYAAAGGQWRDAPDGRLFVRAAPTCEEALAMKAAAVVVIEDVNDAGTHWYLSFDGPNPTEDQCVRCVGRAEAFKLKSLVGQMAAKGAS